MDALEQQNLHITYELNELGANVSNILFENL